MMSVNEYFKSVKTTVYQSVLTRRILYNLLSLLVMLTYFASNAEGSFSSEVFKLVAEGNCRFMCILKFPLLLLPFNLRYLWRLNYWFLGPCHRCISIKCFNYQRRKGLLHEQHTSRLSVTTLFYCFRFVTNNTLQNYQSQLSFIVTVSARTTHFKTISHNSLLLLQFLHEQHTSRLSFTTLFYCYSSFTNNTFQDYHSQRSFIVSVSSRTTHFKTISYNFLLLS